MNIPMGPSKYRMNDAYYIAKGLDPEAERAKREPNHIQDATFARCEKCGERLLVEKGKSTHLVHNGDGSHGYDPESEADLREAWGK